MSDAEWDADDFEPPKATTGTPAVFKDKWEGEDEDDDVKDDWENSDEEDSKGSEDSSTGKAVQVKKKKTLAQKIAEKEAAAALLAEEQQASEAAKAYANTPEGKLDEKLRAQKIAEAADREMARELMGGGPVGSGSIDSMIPTTKDDFKQFSKAISEKVQQFNESSHYNDFVEGLIKDLALDLSAPTLKKVKIHVETLHSTKVKDENAKAKGKKGKKGSTVKMDLTKDLFGGSGRGEEYSEMDDFM